MKEEVIIAKRVAISNPDEQTWFICWDDTRSNLMSYGSVLPTQAMEAMWEEVDWFTQESTWLAELSENGIYPDPDLEII